MKIAGIKTWSEEVVDDLVGDGIFPTFKNVKYSKKRRFDAKQIIGKLLMGNKVAEHLNIPAMHRQPNNKALKYQWVMVIAPLSTIVLSRVRIQSFALVLQFPWRTDDGYVEISVDSPLFQSNFANPGKLVSDILKQSIPGGFGEANLLSKVCVDESRFKKWLLQQRMSATRRSVSVDRVASALGCTKQDVRKLVQEKNLNWATHREWEEWIDGPSLYEYMIRHD